ncbi:MAG: hypothetical protein PF588_08975 [Candidatus Kapabacteria bacterium]|jgi:hypothetical protein|nr:hypothetical protein [Candidatus Kapabacteria bacterium]
MMIKNVFERLYFYGIMSVEYLTSKSNNPEIGSLMSLSGAFALYTLCLIWLMFGEQIFNIELLGHGLAIIIIITAFIISVVIMSKIFYYKGAYLLIIKKYSNISRREKYFGFIFYWSFFILSLILFLVVLFS